jgi:glucuronate isomerase
MSTMISKRYNAKKMMTVKSHAWLLTWAPGIDTCHENAYSCPGYSAICQPCCHTTAYLSLKRTAVFRKVDNDRFATCPQVLAWQPGKR